MPAYTRYVWVSPTDLARVSGAEGEAAAEVAPSGSPKPEGDGEDAEKLAATPSASGTKLNPNAKAFSFNPGAAVFSPGEFSVFSDSAYEFVVYDYVTAAGLLCCVFDVYLMLLILAVHSTIATRASEVKGKSKLSAIALLVLSALMHGKQINAACIIDIS